MNIVKLLRQRATGGGASPLLTDLAAYWKLDETSGTRFDSVGTNNLTENGSVGSTLGKIGNAATGFSTTDYLVNTSTVGQITGDWTATCWFRTGSDINTNQGIVCRTTTTANDVEYLLDIFSNNVRFVLSTSSGIYVAQTPIATNTTYFVASWYDGTNINISLNDGAVTSTAAPGIPVQLFGSELTVGLRLDDSRPFLGDWIDEVGIWNRVLTSGEITQLYNGSAGLTYPFS
jgi:hypothetical protein